MTVAQRKAEHAIAEAIEAIRRQMPERSLDRVVARIRFGEPLDYDIDWQAFTVAYLLVNYRKALAAIRSITIGSVESVVDAGCGVGAASIALLTVLSEQRRRGPSQLFLVDRSGSQLDTAKSLVATICEHLGLETEIHADCAELSTYTPPRRPSIVLMSHVLGEQTRVEADQLLAVIGGQLIPRGSLLALERGDDNPWVHRDLAPIERCEVDQGTFSISAPEPLGEASERTWETRWLLATRTIDWMSELIDRYFAAWNNQDVAALTNVFSARATYREKPFRPAISGLDEIERYWVCKVLPQSNPVAQPLVIKFGVMSATIEWTTTFDIGESARTVSGQMLVEFDPHSLRISALREVFRTADERAVH